MSIGDYLKMNLHLVQKIRFNHLNMWDFFELV